MQLTGVRVTFRPPVLYIMVNLKRINQNQLEFVMSIRSKTVPIRCIILLFVFSILTDVNAHAIIGSVTEIDYTPVQGVLVTFADESNPENSYSGLTDSQGNLEILLTPTIVSENTPQQFSLDQNYPNPFNPSTTIPYTLKMAGHVNISVYNITGRKVRTLVNGYQTAGHHTVTWNGRDKDDRNVSAGVYIYRIQTGGHTTAKKMLLIDGGSIQRGHTLGFSNRSAAKTASEALYTVTAVKDGYHNFQQEHVSIEVDSLNIIITPKKIHGIDFVPIPGGTFRIGDIMSSLGGVGTPVHSVTLSSFEMSIYEVTNAQYTEYLIEALASGDITVLYYSVKGNTGDWSGQEYLDLNSGDCEIDYTDGTFTIRNNRENHPLIEMTWCGSKAFAAYYGFDLPTEAEWEYACRAGTETTYYISPLSRAAWYKENADDWTHPVGQKEPNTWGLYDMHGNVWEWCNDFYRKDYYSSSPSSNPTGPQTGFDDRELRVQRGGSWAFSTEFCNSAGRYGGDPNNSYPDNGFRVVRRLGGLTH